MKKLLISAAFLAIIIGASWNSAALLVYKIKHPSLIGFDYGILTKTDLTISDQEGYVYTLDGDMSGYPYWQCFHKDTLKLSCSYNEPLDQQGSSFGIDIETKSARHSYGLPHAISGSVCDLFIARIKKALKGHTYYCIRGYNDGSESQPDKKSYDWTFLSVKTNSGYMHYFENDAKILRPIVSLDK